ncbi:membrane-associated protease RseP (regulator of RpoE activity) [Haloferula luteola]|uniref:Membrane-associated protease RseP (Regulator of RpoE activity) n=1 Tax=Haloferula luteola TaxID=595692 RepID=A0A840V4Z2_9BACT|nr:PDZ domain-containing protein [Haloferula luteola]MBB5353337.1 membrane-associated protease RseP (regulator of RpoE activity) [Haloferula luteola]
MKTNLFQLLAVAAVVPPLMAIEPSQEVVPTPPRQRPAQVSPVAPIAPIPRIVVPPRDAEEERALDEPFSTAPEEGQAYLGVVLDRVPDFLAEHLKLNSGEGVIVTDLIPDGPAASGGLRKGDVILRVNERPVGDRQDVIDITGNMAVGDKVKVEAIQEGERKPFTVELAARPSMPDVQPLQGRGMSGGVFPDRHSDVLRDALERNMRLLDQLDREMPDLGENITGGMMERLKQDMSLGGSQSMQFRSSGSGSSIRLSDERGCVELTNDGSGKQAKVYDREGKLTWQGPYETDEDRAAAPDEVRQRLDRVDFGNTLPSLGGKGIQLKLQGNRYRPAEEVDDSQRPPAGLEDPVGE